MWLSYLILAATDILLMTVTLVLGLMVGSRAPGVEPPEPLFTKHVLLGIATMFFTGFVHVLGFTYFVVQARMALEARAAGAIPLDAAQRVVMLKRRMMHGLLLGFGSVLVAGICGALVAGRPAFDPLWHMAAGLFALAANGLAFGLQLPLIRENARLFDRSYGPRG